jgi:hypothetical protein
MNTENLEEESPVYKVSAKYYMQIFDTVKGRSKQRE